VTQQGGGGVRSHGAPDRETAMAGEPPLLTVVPPKPAPAAVDQKSGNALDVLLVTAEHKEWKLAKYISAVQPGWSRNAAANCIKQGSILVNGEVSGANRVLQIGDSVGIHAEPPAAEAPATGPTLTADEISHLVAERIRAKAVRDFAKADKLYAELKNSRVRLDDRAKTWTAPENNLSGVQTELTPEEIAALRNVKKDTEKPGAGGASKDPAAAAEAEAERRRIKNMKKRQSKARKAEGTAGTADAADAAPGMQEGGGDEGESSVGIKRKDAPE
jgi:hypothetical protein